jgi:signal peptidase
MSRVPDDKEKPGWWTRFRTSKDPWVSLGRELLWVVAVVGGIALALFLVSGTWPAVVTIESESMVPHMHVGDLVFVAAADRFGPLQTWEDARSTQYEKYGGFGDIIIYQPNGASGSAIPVLGMGVHPIIHRAITEFDGNGSIPRYYYFYPGADSPKEYLPVTIGDSVWTLSNGTVVARVVSGRLVPDTANTSPDYGYISDSGTPAANPGFITRGDNNYVSDQGGFLSRRDLGVIQPVKKEWVVGKALFSIPLLGYLPLNIVPVAIIIIALMLLWEYYQRQKGAAKGKTKTAAKSGRKPSRGRK